MDPTNCSAGLRGGSSIMVGSVSPIGDVPMIPLSAMNASMSNPSIGLEVDRKNASRGQKKTNRNVASRTAGVEKPCGGVEGGELLFSWRRKSFDPFSNIFVSSFSSICPLFSWCVTSSFSRDGSRFELHLVVRKFDDGNGIAGNSRRHGS